MGTIWLLAEFKREVMLFGLFLVLDQVCIHVRGNFANDRYHRILETQRVVAVILTKLESNLL